MSSDPCKNEWVMIDWFEINRMNGWRFGPWPPLNEIHSVNGKNRLVQRQETVNPLPKLVDVQIIVIIPICLK